MTASPPNTTPAPRMGRQRRSGRRAAPVAVYLFALVLVILLPALVVSLVLINRTNQAQEQVVRSLTNTTVQAVGQSVEREIAGMVTTLRVLSTSELLRDDMFSEFHSRAATALAGTGAFLIVLDPDFQQMLNTRVPYGTPLGLTSSPATSAQALQRNGPTVSGLFFGETAGRWVYNVLLPVPESDDAALLVLTQNAQDLARALQTQRLPPGWHAALVDNGNMVVAATPEAGFDTGDVLPMRQVLEQAPEEWRREFFDGEQVVTSEWRSALSGWRVVAWASTDAVDRPLGDALLWLAAWGIIIALAAALLAFLIAERIGISVRGLRRDAQRLGRGELVAAKAYPVAEIAEVSRALADASSARQAADNEVRFLMREVAHRAKNQMTVIAAMARQTARGVDDVPGYVQAFERRIHGLARSTDLLLTHGRAGVSLRELVEIQISPFSPDNPDRVKISGPPVRLNMQAAQILGMALHELASNAVKYGAFGEAGGSVAVDWALSPEHLEFSWRESVPHKLTRSERVGFGTTVLRSMVGRSLGAEVDNQNDEHGVKWRFAIPLSAIDPEQMPDMLEDRPVE